MEKHPGTDGLSSDFYNVFWIDIKHLLIESILYVMKTGELSIEQKRGIISLLPSKKIIDFKKKATLRPS